jgi:hypothetical protein
LVVIFHVDSGGAGVPPAILRVVDQVKKPPALTASGQARRRRHKASS